MMAALGQNNNFSLIEHALLCLLKERNKERKKEDNSENSERENGWKRKHEKWGTST